MKTLTLLRSTAALAMVVLSAHGQDMLQNALNSAYEDMADIKHKAEQGDARAQYKLANALASRFHQADALEWYLKAARQGDLESLYRAGSLLLFGEHGIPNEQSVPANSQEGIRLVFLAATNGHHAASHDMYRAYQNGCGVAKDAVQAYAWLQLYYDTFPSFVLPPMRSELNQLALQVDTVTSQEGKRLAALYRSGRWPTLVIQAAPSPKRTAYGLKLNGITLGATPLAIINGKSLAPGETATIPAKPQPIVIKCLKVEKDSVLVLLDGETEPRELRR